MRLIAACPLLALSACTLVVGNGNRTSEAQTVGAFSKIDVGSILNATVGPGSRSVTVTTDQNLQQYVEVSVVGDTLRLRTTSDVSFSGGLGSLRSIDVAVTNDLLEAITASGSADVIAAATPVTTFPIDASGSSNVQVTSLSATNLQVTATGSSDVTVSGTATNGILIAKGSSDVDTKGVSLQTADLELSGSSDLRSSVSTTLTGNLSGDSSATVTGNPASSVNRTGDSDLTLNAP
jgi:Putative auto-transporter adhesin, head GIN domain